MTNIPTGYMEDAYGNLVAISNIKEIDKLRDDLVKKLAWDAKKASAHIAKYKQEAFAEILAFVELSAKEYGTKIGGRKGNITLHSFDGKHKIQIANADNISFDERLQVAKNLIDECIIDWAGNADDKIKTLVNHAFQVDKEGKVSSARILGLRRLKIEDEKWFKAMQAISDSITVSFSKKYIRLYERNEATGEFLPIKLDIARI
jgi:hypothetical protein